MAKFPKQLTIRVSETDSGKAIPGVALKLTLFAPQKNNYTIPAVTNASGQAQISADHVRQSIQDDWNLFPMDYVSPLEECSADVELKVCSTEDVHRTIQAMKMFRSVPTISDELIEGFENSVNDRYFPTVQRLNVETSDFVEIVLQARNEENRASPHV
jgi:hypothetical protein